MRGHRNPVVNLFLAWFLSISVLSCILTLTAACAATASSARAVSATKVNIRPSSPNGAPGAVFGVGAGGGVIERNYFPGPPNCTWWAWQHVHDTERIDLQATGNAGQWIQEVQQLGNFAAWSEVSNRWTPVQLLTTPSVGDVVVVPHADGKYASTNAGHVGYVEQLINNDAFKVSAQDYGASYGTYTSVWSLSDLQGRQHGDARFIHFPDGPLAHHAPPPSGPTDAPISPTSTPTRAPSPSPSDGATYAAESAFPTVQPGESFSIWFRLTNSGSTTWSDGSGYALMCTSTCLGASNAGFGGHIVSPGQSWQFQLNMTAPTSPGTYRTWWEMAHGSQTFGPYVWVDVTVQPPSGWYAVLQESAPNCSDPYGVTWDEQEVGSGNVITCSGSALLMQQGQAYYPEDNLDDVNGGGYDPSTFRVSTHVSFNSVNSTTYDGTDATIVVDTPQSASACGGYLFEIRPNGQWRVQATNSGCSMSIVSSGQFGGGASSYDLMVMSQNGTLYGFVDGQQVVSWGNSINSGVCGLMVVDFAWPTAQVYFSTFELDQWR